MELQTLHMVGMMNIEQARETKGVQTLNRARRNKKEDEGERMEEKIDERENQSSPENRQYLPMKVILVPLIH